MITLPRRPDWHDLAACKDTPTTVMYPTRSEDVAPALAVCAPCPVRDRCLAEHLGEVHGIWGGTTGRERRALRLRSLSTTTPQHPAASKSLDSIAEAS